MVTRILQQHALLACMASIALVDRRYARHAMLANRTMTATRRQYVKRVWLASLRLQMLWRASIVRLVMCRQLVVRAFDVKREVNPMLL